MNKDRNNTTYEINSDDNEKVLTSKQYKRMLDSYWINNYNKKSRRKIKKTFSDLNESGKTDGSIFKNINLFFKDKNNEIYNAIEKWSKDTKGGAFAFSKGDSMFLTAHGTKSGKILFQGKEYDTKEFVETLETQKLLPEDIKKIYTLNCYGGKQQSFITSKGVQVSSGHTSDKPIFMSGNKTHKSVYYAVDKNADITDSLKKDLLRLKDEKIKDIILPDKIKKAFIDRPIEVAKEKVNKTIKEKPKVQKTKKKNKPKSKPSKTPEKPKPKVKPQDKTINKSTENYKKINIAEEKQKRNISNVKPKQQEVKPKSNKQKSNLQNKILSSQELYDLNKNSNLKLQYTLKAQSPKPLVVNNKSTNVSQKLDIRENKKNMAMMVNALQKSNTEQVVTDTAAQIAKNICSSGNRYGKSAISIVSKLI